jgi:hypothetical protein
MEVQDASRPEILTCIAIVKKLSSAQGFCPVKARNLLRRILKGQTLRDQETESHGSYSRPFWASRSNLFCAVLDSRVASIW